VLGLAAGLSVAVVLGACGSSGDEDAGGAAGEAAVTTTVSSTVPAPTAPIPTEPTVPAPPPMPAPLFVFATPASVEAWRSTNDTVMGGVSVGGLSWADEAMVFSGELSLDNNGGFTSVVSPALNAPVWAVPDGVALDVTGDGRTYTLQVRSATSGYWVQPFATVAGVPQRLVLPWSLFSPVSRFLDPIPAPGPLDPADVEALAIYLVDGQEGPFELAVRAVG
jgi:hypothetical protein